MSSFVRQLNAFGFKRERSKEISYFHPLFLRDRPELLQHISRKTTQYLRVSHPLREAEGGEEDPEDDAMQVDEILQLMVAAGEIDAALLAGTASGAGCLRAAPSPTPVPPGSLGPADSELLMGGAAEDPALNLGLGLTDAAPSRGMSYGHLHVRGDGSPTGVPFPSPPPLEGLAGIPALFPQPTAMVPVMDPTTGQVFMVPAPAQDALLFPQPHHAHYAVQQPQQPLQQPAYLPPAALDPVRNTFLTDRPLTDEARVQPLPEAAGPLSPRPLPSTEARQGRDMLLPPAQEDDTDSIGTHVRRRKNGEGAGPSHAAPPSGGPGPARVPPAPQPAPQQPLNPAHIPAPELAAPLLPQDPGAFLRNAAAFGASVPVLDPATGRVFMLPFNSALQFLPRTAATVMGPVRPEARSISSQISTKDEEEDTGTGARSGHVGSEVSPPPVSLLGFQDLETELAFLREVKGTRLFHPVSYGLLPLLLSLRAAYLGASLSVVAPWHVQLAFFVVAALALLDRDLFDRHHTLWGPVIVVSLIFLDLTQLTWAIALFDKADQTRQLAECLYRLLYPALLSNLVWVPIKAVIPGLVLAPLIVCAFAREQLSLEHLTHPEFYLFAIGVAFSTVELVYREWRARREFSRGLGRLGAAAGRSRDRSREVQA